MMELVYKSLSDSSGNDQGRGYSEIIGWEEENYPKIIDILKHNKTSKESSNFWQCNVRNAN